jgi:hypothetical protein
MFPALSSGKNCCVVKGSLRALCGSRFGRKFIFLHPFSPIPGIAIVKIPAETLKQKTILFKLILMLVNLFRSVSDIGKMSATTKQNANNREVSAINPVFRLHQSQGQKKVISLKKGANHVGAKHVRPSTEPYGRTRVDD